MPESVITEKTERGANVSTNRGKREPKTPGIPLSDVQDDEFYSVAYGYGQRKANQVTWVDNTKFVGGICKEVDGATIKSWRKTPRLRFTVHAYGASEAEIAADLGIVLQAPEQTAAILRTTDVDSLVEALGQEAARQLAQQILARCRNVPTQK